ncbi:MAG TPA: hypothetical protein VF678_02895 [bacterium]
MKRFALAALLAIAITLTSGKAFAASVSVDLPFQFTFSNEFLDKQKQAKPKDRDATANGFILTATGGLLGAAYEHYEVNGKGQSNNPFDIRMSFQFYDLLVDLPFPVANLAVGYGVGTINTQLSGTGAPTIGEADATQAFARLGIPFGKLLDLHLGYHLIRTEGGKFAGTNDKFIPEGRTLTVGVRAGW